MTILCPNCEKDTLTEVDGFPGHFECTDETCTYSENRGVQKPPTNIQTLLVQEHPESVFTKSTEQLDDFFRFMVER